MKTRITYVHEAEGEFDPKQASVAHDSVSISGLKGARELKINVGFEELPQELRQILNQSRELNFHWVAESPFPAIAPFESRTSPGLHVIYTPSEKAKVGDRLLCALLQKVFSDNLKCVNPATSFTTSPVASKKSLHFHQLLPSPENLVTYLQQKLCQSDSGDSPCHQSVSALRNTDYVDINYDRESSSLNIVGYWCQPPQRGGWTETIRTDNAHGKVEVGILAAQQPLDPHELRVGGFLAVVGEDKALKPTLFSFPSRHHPLPKSSTYTTSFSTPTGLHPTLKLTMPHDALTSPPGSACSLHTFLTLPSTLFADKYQLSTADPLFLQSHNLLSLRSISGETDLEMPDWATNRWGSQLLLELATPQTSSSHGSGSSSGSGDDWEATIPLHLRYLHPSASGHRKISIPWPIVFWACAASPSQDEEALNFDSNPFDRRNLAWDELFTPRTTFHQLHPSSSSASSSSAEYKPLVEEIQVPVLQMADDGPAGSIQALNIGWGTVVVIAVGFAWVLWKLGIVARRYGVGPNVGTATPRRAEKVKAI